MLVEDLDGHDVANAHGGSQSRDVGVQTTTLGVLRQQHGRQDVLGGEERRVSGALVVLAVQDRRVDDAGGVEAVNLGVDRGDVELVVRGDRTDVLLLDLVLVSVRAAVADQDRSGDLLLEHEAHLGLQPHHDVEVRDVHDIVAVQLLLLVDGLRGGNALQKLEELLLLQVPLDVTLCAGLLHGDVSREGLDSRERGVSRAAHDVRDPLGLALDEVRRVGDSLGVGEHQVDALDAVLKRVLLHGLLQGAHREPVLEDGLDVRMRQDRALGLGVSRLENIVRHGNSFLRRIGVVNGGVVGFGGGFGRAGRLLNGIVLVVLVIDEVLGVVGRLLHDIVDEILLLIGHLVIDVLKRPLGVGVSIRVCDDGGGHTGEVVELVPGENDELVINRLLETVVGENHVIDLGFRVSAAQNQAHLSDDPVHDVLRALDNVRGVDGHRGDVAVLYSRARMRSVFGVIEAAMSVNAIGAVLKHSVA